MTVKQGATTIPGVDCGVGLNPDPWANLRVGADRTDDSPRHSVLESKSRIAYGNNGLGAGPSFPPLCSSFPTMKRGCPILAFFARVGTHLIARCGFRALHRGESCLASRVLANRWRYFSFTNNKTKIAHTPMVTGN